MESDEECDACAALIVAAAMIEAEEQKGRKRKTLWSREWLKKRNTHGSYATLYKELRTNEQLFQKYSHVPFILMHLLNLF